MCAGTIFNVQKYSIHDGPGIRTTIFLKGCPLACWWCHNPESLAVKPEIIFLENKCIGCGDCENSCPNAAITLFDKGVSREVAKCSLCECCIEACPTGAMEKVGRQMTVADVMKEIEKDSDFYEQSGGGVTFSGGEALLQPEFLDGLLTACKSSGIHTVLDTCGYAPWQSVGGIADKVDLFLYDIKLMDDEQHRKYTGVSNELIFENLERLAAINCNIWIRVPVIAGINDGTENIERLGTFVSSLQLQHVNLLPYHNIAMTKYGRLGKTYQLAELQNTTTELLEDILQRLTAFGLQVKIGG